MLKGYDEVMACRRVDFRVMVGQGQTSGTGLETNLDNAASWSKFHNELH